MASENDLAAEIKKQFTAGSRHYFSLLKTFLDRLLSRQNKLILLKTLVQPFLTCASQTWTTSKLNEKDLMIFEQQILHLMIGAVNTAAE